MSLFALIEYLRYRRAAMGRHGLHSPAVYRFVEEGLRPPERAFTAAVPYASSTGERWPDDPLMRRIVHHFRFEEIVVAAARGGEGRSFLPLQPLDVAPGIETYKRLLDWRELLPQHWMAGISEAGGVRDAVVVCGIHDTEPQATAWKHLCDHPRVTLSLDLFRVGLLFFAPQFKVRQHFVLKYPY